MLVGEELHAARLGSLRARQKQLAAEIRELEQQAQPIERETRA